MLRFFQVHDNLSTDEEEDNRSSDEEEENVKENKTNNKNILKKERNGPGVFPRGRLASLSGLTIISRWAGRSLPRLPCDNNNRGRLRA